MVLVLVNNNNNNNPYSRYIYLAVLVFHGNQTHDLGVASIKIYQLSYKKANQYKTQISLELWYLLYVDM